MEEGQQRTSLEPPVANQQPRRDQSARGRGRGRGSGRGRARGRGAAVRVENRHDTNDNVPNRGRGRGRGQARGRGRGSSYNNSRPAPAAPNRNENKPTRRRKPPKTEYLDAIKGLVPVAVTPEPKPIPDLDRQGANLIKNYGAKCIGSYSSNGRMQAKCSRTDVARIRQTMTFPARPPAYQMPVTPLQLKEKKRGYTTGEASATHLLVAAQCCQVDLTQFDFVTERYNLNQIASYNSQWAIGVQKQGKTIYLTSLVDFMFKNTGDFGTLFEDACTVSAPDSSSYLRLISSRIGKFSLLIGCETDGVRQDTLDDCVELKTSNQVPNETKLNAWWLQSFLGGVGTVVIGRKEPSSTVKDVVTIAKIEERNTDSLIPQAVMELKLSILESALTFLAEHVEDGKVYLFQRGKQSAELRSRNWELFPLPPNLEFVSNQIIADVSRLSIPNKA